MPKALRRLVALRHTQVAVRAGLCYGQIDVPLAASYPEDLQKVRQNLPAGRYARVICSPLQRCYQLALDLDLGPVERDARLLELSFGAWEGQLWSEIPRHLSEHWTDDVVHRAPPGGESFLELIHRVQGLLREVDLWAAGEPLLLVTHAGVLRALHHILAGETYTDALNKPIRYGENQIWTFETTLPGA